MSGDPALTREVKALAHEAGFARVGVAQATALEPEGAQLQAWLQAGRHGQMTWMERTAKVRKDPRDANMVDGAKAVIVMAVPYGGAPVDAAPGRVARYARGRDYHRVLSKWAARIVHQLETAGFIARAAVDSKPVLERAWAERAGVGFVGKNCCLIVPGLGSHVFLTCVITTAELVPDAPMARRCGSCTRCLVACPTDAFVAPRELDARRCISYLTIEHQGPVPDEHRQGMGDWLFGCDVCQDVCPYNHGVASDQAAEPAFDTGARWKDFSAVQLLQMDEAAFSDWGSGSPVKRGKLEGLARNASIVLGNHGSKTHLPVLREAARSHDSEVVREAADWATRQINQRS